MDVSTLLSNLDISWFKLLFMRLFNKTALYEYVLDKANTAINALLAANADTVGSIRTKLATINKYLCKFVDFIPEAWVSYANGVNALMLEVYNATADNQVVSDEAKGIIEKARIAYSTFKSED